MQEQRRPLFKGKEFLTIKEFAAFAGIEQTTLRYWDEIGLFSPEERNPGNNYRYYSPLQQSTVNFITLLSGMGIPLQQIGAIEKTRTPDTIIGLLERQESLLDMEMMRLRETFSIIHRLRDMIKTGKDVDEKEVSVIHIEEMPFVMGPRNDWESDPSYFETFMAFCGQAPELRINLGFPIGGLHDSLEEFLRAPGQPNYYFSIDPTGYDRRPAREFLAGYARGYYGEMGDLPQRLTAYAGEHGLTLEGPVYTVYMHDEICVRDHSRYLARVSIAVKENQEGKAVLQ